MANTTNLEGNFIEITGLDEDWTLATDMPGFETDGLRIKSIEFNPSAVSDAFVVRNSSATGPKIFDVSCDSVNDQKLKYYDGPNGVGQQMWPYIKIADATLDTAANASVKIELA